MARFRGNSIYFIHHSYLLCNNLQGLLTNDISSFYFSIIKDRLYTMSQASLGRRSAQTALFHILEILVRLVAPILSFTAEEIWQEIRMMDKVNGITSRAESVFMARFSEVVAENNFDLSQDQITASDWSEIQNYRTAVNKELEKLRADNIIGSSLEAVVKLYCDDKVLSKLAKLKDDLRFVLITSDATVLAI